MSAGRVEWCQCDVRDSAHLSLSEYSGTPGRVVVCADRLAFQVDGLRP